MVSDDRTTGTPDDAAAARARRKAPRSVHITAKFCGLKIRRTPSARSVALTKIRGPSGLRSAYVAPLNRISSYRSAASSERPQPVDASAPQLKGLRARV